MTHNVRYRYLSVNGIVETPLFLEGATGIKINILIADPGKILSNGKEKKHQVFVSDAEIELWQEIDE